MYTCKYIVFGVATDDQRFHLKSQVSGGSRISLGGVNLVGGSVDSQGGYVSTILHIETKESGPLGGVRRARPLDLPMQVAITLLTSTY